MEQLTVLPANGILTSKKPCSQEPLHSVLKPKIAAINTDLKCFFVLKLRWNGIKITKQKNSMV
jgi:hypothetical protein